MSSLLNTLESNKAEYLKFQSEVSQVISALSETIGFISNISTGVKNGIKVNEKPIFYKSVIEKKEMLENRLNVISNFVIPEINEKIAGLNIQIQNEYSRIEAERIAEEMRLIEETKIKSESLTENSNLGNSTAILEQL